MNTNTATYRFWALVLLFSWPLQVAVAGCNMSVERTGHKSDAEHAASKASCCVDHHSSAGENERCHLSATEQQPSDEQPASSCNHQMECACSLTNAEARRSLTTAVPTITVKFVMVDTATLQMPDSTRDNRWTTALNDEYRPRSQPLFVLNESFLN